MHFQHAEKFLRHTIFHLILHKLGDSASAGDDILSCRFMCVCVFANSKQHKGIVAVGCLYTIVASFIGLCGLNCTFMCVCLHNVLCFFFSFYMLLFVRVLLIHNKSSRMFSVKIHILLCNETNEEKRNEKKKYMNHTHTHTYTLTTNVAKTTDCCCCSCFCYVPFNRTEFFQFSSALSVVA